MFLRDEQADPVSRLDTELAALARREKLACCDGAVQDEVVHTIANGVADARHLRGQRQRVREKRILCGTGVGDAEVARGEAANETAKRKAIAHHLTGRPYRMCHGHGISS